MPLIEKIFPKLDDAPAYRGDGRKEHLPESALPLIAYEDLVEAQSDALRMAASRRKPAASICYTSGTTGNPKGVLYSHRSTVLHAMSVCGRACSASPARTSVLAGRADVPRQCLGHPLCGGDGRGQDRAAGAGGLDGKSIFELVDGEQVDLMLGVPTVWLNLLNYCEKRGPATWIRSSAW